MKKSISQIIDELTVTNIKIFHLAKKKKHTSQDKKKLQELNEYRSQLHNALDKSKTMKKSLSSIVDELTVTNIKIFHLVEKIAENKHTRQDAKKAQELNKYRSELLNALNKEFKQRKIIKV